MICNQGGCGANAVFRFTWPGHSEAGICLDHSPALRGVAASLGLPLSLEVIVERDLAKVDVAWVIFQLKHEVERVENKRHMPREYHSGYKAGLLEALELLDPGAGST